MPEAVLSLAASLPVVPALVLAPGKLSLFMDKARRIVADPDLFLGGGVTSVPSWPMKLLIEAVESALAN